MITYLKVSELLQLFQHSRRDRFQPGGLHAGFLLVELTARREGRPYGPEATRGEAPDLRFKFNLFLKIFFISNPNG
jgi:hypothetical protein